jgi:hypothetical protein
MTANCSANIATRIATANVSDEGWLDATARPTLGAEREPVVMPIG